MSAVFVPAIAVAVDILSSQFALILSDFSVIGFEDFSRD
jgi:hypothetical protein